MLPLAIVFLPSTNSAPAFPPNSRPWRTRRRWLRWTVSVAEAVAWHATCWRPPCWSWTAWLPVSRTDRLCCLTHQQGQPPV